MSQAAEFFSKIKKEKESGNFKSLSSIIDNVLQAENDANPSPSGKKKTTYHVAVQGCCHGELRRIYENCRQHELSTGKTIDLLLCCGDFQSIRGVENLDSMAVPEKHKRMGDFHYYYHSNSQTPREVGERRNRQLAPYLTVFIGGNHEDSDLLAEESYGGFVAPNIYYLGHSGVIQVRKLNGGGGGLVIAGLSGIYKEPDYLKPYPPRPYANDEHHKRSAYHVRAIEVEKLRSFGVWATTERLEQERRSRAQEEKGEEEPHDARVHLFLSHDWPVGITAYGNEAQLIRYKPYFAEDIKRGELGNKRTFALMRLFQPEWWFAAHLHCRFQATVQHDEDIHTGDRKTKFVALDKCTRDRGCGDFLDFIDVQVDDSDGEETTRGHHSTSYNTTDTILQRHPVWLRILKDAHPLVANNNVREFNVNNAFQETAVTTADGSDPTAALTRAMDAPNTFELLEALRLPPALPLQNVFHRPSIPSGNSSFSSVPNPPTPVLRWQHSVDPTVHHPPDRKRTREDDVEEEKEPKEKDSAQSGNPGALDWFSAV